MVKMIKLDPAEAIPGWRVVLPNGREVLVEGRFGFEIRCSSNPVPMLVLTERVRAGVYELSGTNAPRYEQKIRMMFAIGPGMHWSFHEDLRDPAR